MCLCVFDGRQYLEKKNILVPCAGLAAFAALSEWLYSRGIRQEPVSFLMGLLACASIFTLIIAVFRAQKQPAVLGWLAKYTTPIFLMHVMCAATLRTVLLKIGGCSAAVHIVLGLAAGFGGPILAAEIMKKIGWPEFFLYSRKHIRAKNE